MPPRKSRAPREALDADWAEHEKYLPPIEPEPLDPPASLVPVRHRCVMCDRTFPAIAGDPPPICPHCQWGKGIPDRATPEQTS